MLTHVRSIVTRKEVMNSSCDTVGNLVMVSFSQLPIFLLNQLPIHDLSLLIAHDIWGMQHDWFCMKWCTVNPPIAKFSHLTTILKMALFFLLLFLNDSDFHVNFGFWGDCFNHTSLVSAASCTETSLSATPGWMLVMTVAGICCWRGMHSSQKTCNDLALTSDAHCLCSCLASCKEGMMNLILKQDEGSLWMDCCPVLCCIHWCSHCDQPHLQTQKFEHCYSTTTWMNWCNAL